MLLFATSDKGGTGRSVTSSNVLYRFALQGQDGCYLDFDFGSPTSGAIFDLPGAMAGVPRDGLHSYLRGSSPEAQALDVWTESERGSLRGRPAGAGRLVLYPGDVGGGEFPTSPQIVERCITLFQRLDEEFDLCVVDLSAGRSYATEIVLAATASPRLAHVRRRWLVFHRWTRQHIIAASGLVHGDRGILAAGGSHGHDPRELRDSIRFVRTAVLDLKSSEMEGLRPEQATWLEICDRRLQELASRHRVGRTSMLGQIPLDPVLQWQEQLLSNNDVWLHRTANEATVTAFETLAKQIVDDSAWEGL